MISANTDNLHKNEKEKKGKVKQTSIVWVWVITTAIVGGIVWYTAVNGDKSSLNTKTPFLIRLIPIFIPCVVSYALFAFYCHFRHTKHPSQHAQKIRSMCLYVFIIFCWWVFIHPYAFRKWNFFWYKEDTGWDTPALMMWVLIVCCVPVLFDIIRTDFIDISLSSDINTLLTPDYLKRTGRSREITLLVYYAQFIIPAILLIGCMYVMFCNFKWNRYVDVFLVVVALTLLQTWTEDAYHLHHDWAGFLLALVATNAMAHASTRLQYLFCLAVQALGIGLSIHGVYLYNASWGKS